MIGIYKISSPSGRVYVGQSTNLESRIKDYKRGHGMKKQRKLENSFNKYGIKEHIFEIVEECVPEILNIRERYWQDFYNCLKEGLNCRLTTTSDKSGKMSDETRQKMRDSFVRNSSHNGQAIREYLKNKPRKYSDAQIHDICSLIVEGKRNYEILEILSYTTKSLLNCVRNKYAYHNVTENYNLIPSSRKFIPPKEDKVLCVEDNIRFKTLEEAAKYYGVFEGSIRRRINYTCKSKLSKLDKTFILLK